MRILKGTFGTINAGQRNASNAMPEKYPTFKMADFTQLKFNQQYKEGVGIFYLESWEQYCDELIPKMENQENGHNKILDFYLWRGQRCDHKNGLLSSFDRWYTENVIDRNDKHRDSLSTKHLEVFRTNYDKVKKPSIKPKDDIYWALAQHHGYPTPLLDWTTDPYIAAYFAFHKKDKENQPAYRVIYALNRKINLLLLKTKRKIKDIKTKEVIKVKNNAKERFIEIPDIKHFSFPIKYLPFLKSVPDPYQNKRLKYQKGRFTRALNGDDIETNINKLVAIKHEQIEGDQKIILLKMLIPNQEKNKSLEWLRDNKGIVYTKLFPDVEGAVIASKMELGINRVSSLDTP